MGWDMHLKNRFVAFTTTLRGQWSNDTIDGRAKSLDGNRYAHIFNSKQYFAKLY